MEVNLLYNLSLGNITHFALTDLYLNAFVDYGQIRWHFKLIIDASKAHVWISTCQLAFWLASCQVQKATCSFVLGNTPHTLWYRAKTIQHVGYTRFAIGALQVDQITLNSPHMAGISVKIILRTIPIIGACQKGKYGGPIQPNYTAMWTRF